MQDFEQQMADHNDAESRRQKGEPKEGKKRDLSKYTPAHLRKMKAGAADLLDQIEEELQSRDDTGAGIKVTEMNEQQYERWSRKQIDKADRQKTVTS
jgi:hypothetical protein